MSLWEPPGSFWEGSNVLLGASGCLLWANAVQGPPKDNQKKPKAQDIYNKFVVQGADFNQHIFTSIPTFYEAQIVKGVALSNMLNNFEKVNVTSESPKIKVLDIGATEGTWSK